jgi:hypothetical protein
VWPGAISIRKSAQGQQDQDEQTIEQQLMDKVLSCHMLVSLNYTCVSIEVKASMGRHAPWY